MKTVDGIDVIFEKFMEEKQKWNMSALIGKEFDFTNLRKYAAKLNEASPKTFPFKLDGTDAELMSSIVEAEKKYRP